MKCSRWIAAFLVLAACVAERPVTVPVEPGSAAAPIRIVPPDGYCMPSEDDWVSTELVKGLRGEARHLQYRFLGTILPCRGQPQVMPPGATTYRRIFFIATAKGPLPLGLSIPDREAFLTDLANPRFLKVLGQNLLPFLWTSGITEEGIQGSELTYLGRDDIAAYAAATTAVDLSARGRRGSIRQIYGMTLLRGQMLTVIGVSLAINMPPDDWDTLRAATVKALRFTVQAADATSP